MPKYKSLILASKVEPAIKPRKCRFNKQHVIAPGVRCLAVTSSYGGTFSYCFVCATKMFNLSAQKLAGLVRELGPTPPDKPASKSP